MIQWSSLKFSMLRHGGNPFFRSLCSTSSPQPANNLCLHLHLHLRSVLNLCERGHFEEGLSLFYSLNAPIDAQTYAALFHACARHRQLHLGQSFHRHMLHRHPNRPPDLYLDNHIVNMYAKCGELDYARQLFDQMPQKNIVSWTALVSGYSQYGRVDECFGVFSEMLGHFRPTEFAFAAVLSSSTYDQGRQVHALALKSCLDAYVYVANALIIMYSRNFWSWGCSGIRNGYRDEAWSVFESLECRNLISWNSMIAGFQIRGHWAKAIKLFNQMHRDGIGFDRATLLSTISSLSGIDVENIELGLHCCCQLHDLSIKTGLILEAEVSTVLVKAYSNLGGDFHDCYRLFMDSSEHRDIVSWTGIITTFAEQIPQAALSLFCQLHREGWVPDSFTLSSVLKACAGLMTARHASAVHLLVVKAGLEGDTVLANALLHSYARCGSIALSKQVFDELEFHDTVSWNSMLKAYSLHGQAGRALELFSEMDVQPDAATFVALLSACSHVGMVEEGAKIFDTMLKNHGVAPELDHYACMVDIYGRAGRILEAKNLVSRMPMEPDSVVWSALLGACRKYGETELGKLAAAKLRELDPDNSLGYVMMSNIYSSDGNFDEAALLRRKMKGSRVMKRPGLSWTEVGNQVHEFASGGLRHPQREAICVELETLIQQLKDMGYAPDTSLVLHDIGEEQKAEQLYYHSEKLALTFALMDASSQSHPQADIKIMKNIRICLDCHNFMKFASKLAQKEIIVRDSNRFHHFKEGVCSCNDYW